jgi:predicted alpha/beta superfamily hydrolase
MKNRIKGMISAAFALLLSVSVFSQAETFPQVRIPNTEERTLYSKIMDYEYGVYVTLPGGYKENPGKIYPALYIIDGNQYFVFTAEPYGSLVWGNMVREHITISVAYPPGKENYRARDFRTQERAADFVKFFQNELIPFVEDHYRTSGKDRTLFGHSLGGHFTLYMLLNAPETFGNYIASAPAVSDEIMKFEEDFAATHHDFPVKLFLASGENDHLTISAKKFAEKFKSRNYPSLKFEELYTINGNHGTIQPTAYIEGLRFVLDPAIELAPEDFERLAGTYTDGENRYTLRYDGGNFLTLEDVSGTYDAWLDAPLVEWSRIYPVSRTSFIAKGWPGAFEFGGDVSLPAETFRFTLGGNQIEARRQP